MSKQFQEEAGAHETLEPVVALIRQSASRAMERLRLQFTRNQAGLSRGSSDDAPPPIPSSNAPLTAASMRKPMDVFVIQYCMYYLDTHKLPAKHYARLAQEVVTSSVERVLVPSLFQPAVSLPMLCESLVLERSAEEVQTCLKEMEEFVDAREAVGAWLAGLGDLGPREDDYGDDGWDAYDYGGDRKRRAGEGVDGWPKKEEEEADDATVSRGGRTGEEEVLADDGVMTSGVDIAGWLYRSLEYWLRIRGFLHAWSFSTANLHAYPLKPRYERELMQLLSSLSGAQRRPATLPPGNETGGNGNGVLSVSSFVSSSNPTLATSTSTSAPLTKEEPPIPATSLVKQEVIDLADEEEDVAERIYHGHDDEYDDAFQGAVSGARQPLNGTQSQQQQHRRDVATTVLADVLALSECPIPPDSRDASLTAVTGEAETAIPLTTSSSSSLLLTDKVRMRLRGVHPTFFTMVHARLSVMVARDHLTVFSRSAASPAVPALTSVQENVRQQQDVMRQQYLAYYGAAAGGADGGSTAGGETGAAVSGLPLDYVPDDQYYLRLMQRVAPEEAELGDDEELFKDEVVDYYKHIPCRAGATSSTAADALAPKDVSGQRPEPSNQQAPARDARGRPLPSSPNAPKALIKPERFCRMGTGYRWTQYNRTHYDSHTNPPPRTVMWYKFTLLYPLLADTKKDMQRIFHIEDTPKGPGDDHCILVFSPGPPYADVAYRIVKQQWDRRRGGVNVSFDSTGRFQLFFRFSNSNYRR